MWLSGVPWSEGKNVCNFFPGQVKVREILFHAVREIYKESENLVKFRKFHTFAEIMFLQSSNIPTTVLSGGHYKTSLRDQIVNCLLDLYCLA